MLSAEFATVRISRINKNRGSRVRKELSPDALNSLADSIKRIGLIHPPIITREMDLVAGENRLEAMQLIGWDTCTIQWSDTVDPRELLVIEIEENVKRTDLSWQDQVDAVNRAHSLFLEIHAAESWGVKETAEALGIKERTVYEKLQVAKAIATGDPRVKDAKLFSTAKGIVSRSNERAAGNELDKLLQIENVKDKVRPDAPVLCGDFMEWADAYEGQPFNFIHCDFPYGINADKMDQGAAGSLGGYEDTEDYYWKLVGTLCSNKEKLLGSSGHLMFWFSMKHYAQTLSVLREHFWVDPYPLVWSKSDGAGTLPDPQRGPRRIYEVAFLCSLGDRKIIQAINNQFGAPANVKDRQHMSEKNQQMLEHFFRMLVDGSTRFLDPTCGAGSSLRAARTLGAAHILGIEKNPEFAETAKAAWSRGQ